MHGRERVRHRDAPSAHPPIETPTRGDAGSISKAKLAVSPSYLLHPHSDTHSDTRTHLPG